MYLELFQILIIGASHVRRFEECNKERMFIESKNMEVTFIHRGGARTDWLWTVSIETIYDIIILSIGSNDLKHVTIEKLQDQLNEYARFLISNGYAADVVVFGLWPRVCPRFTTRAKLFNKLSRESMRWSPHVLFWNWSTRLKFHFCDPVHLKRKCYHRALKYLISPVFFLTRNNNQ